MVVLNPLSTTIFTRMAAVRETRMAATPDSESQPWGKSVQQALEKRLESLDSARYRRENERVLTSFAEWVASERDVDELEDITTTDCRRYAQHLRSRVQDDEDDLASGRSAQQYFELVRAWLTWCVEDERLPSNPARAERARKPLPAGGKKEEQQFWTEREREAICATADQRVDESFDDDDLDTEQAYRDRALVYTIAYSGARGAELARVNDDELREGVRWKDVDLDAGLLTVIGKARDDDDPEENAPLLSPAVDALRKWQDYCNPDVNEPVFPRLDRAAGDDPNAISTQAIRDAIEGLCEWSEYEFDEVLKPHGARRGLGHELYDESAELAQEALRHKSVETTHESYRKEQQAAVRDEVEEALLDGPD
jgi:integrase